MIDNKQIAVNINNLCVSYGQHQALSNINVEINDKDFLGIIGPNGGGKSTFLKAILGFLPIEEGTIELFGIPQKKSKEYIAYVPQIPLMDRRFPISVFETVLTGFQKGGFHPFHKFTTFEKEKADFLLQKVDLFENKSNQISDLSGGEFQRLLIARALAVDSKLMLLDEPTANVDAVSRNKIFELLQELNSEKTILLVSHDLMAISSTVKNIACLNKTLIYHGEANLSEEILTKLYGCPIDLIAHGVPHRVLGEHKHEE